jgi:hypothetical protein
MTVAGDHTGPCDVEYIDKEGIRTSHWSTTGFGKDTKHIRNKF